MQDVSWTIFSRRFQILPQIFDILFVNTQKTQLKIEKLIFSIFPSSLELSHSIFIISQVYSNLLQSFMHQLASPGLQNNFLQFL